MLFYFSKRFSPSGLFWNWENILKQNYVYSSCKCRLLQTCFSCALSACTQALTIQILCVVLHTRVLHYSLMYFHIRIIVRVRQKKYLTCIPREHKPFWQLHRLDGFASNEKAYSDPSRTSKMELSASFGYS